MKKLLLNLALFGFIVTSITTVKAITIDLENFSGYGDCKAEECDGTNLVIIGHRMYQLNNPDVVLSGILYTKAQLEYGTEEAPIYYILAGEVKQEIGAVKNGIIPMANKTMDEINGNAYEITYIDGIEMLKDADVTNDATLTDYNNRLNEILSNYTNESGQQILESVVYSEDDNTLTFTVTKDGKEVKLSSFLTETTESNVSIIEAFAAFAENATKVEYTIKGDYTDTVTKDLTGNADPVALAKELLLAIAKENGSKKTTAGSLTYFDVANTTAKAKFYYDLNGFEQVVEYTLNFKYTLDANEAKELKDSKNDTLLIDYRNNLDDAIKSYSALNSLTYNEEDNTLTFDVTRDGLFQNLVEFLAITGNGDTSVENIFKLFTTGATKATYTVSGNGATNVEDFSDPIKLAEDLLLAMAKQKNPDLTKSPAELTYEDVVGADAVTAKFTYNVPGYDGDVEVEYTLKFTYTPNMEQEKIDKKDENDSFIDTYATQASELLGDDKYTALSNITFTSGSSVEEESTLKLEVAQAGLDEPLAGFLALKSSDGRDITEIFKEFAKGATQVVYTIDGQAKDPIKDFSDPKQLAKDLLVAMANNGKDAANLTYRDVVSKTATATFTYSVPGTDETIELKYTLSFTSQALNALQEEKDSALSATMTSLESALPTDNVNLEEVKLDGTTLDITLNEAGQENLVSEYLTTEDSPLVSSITTLMEGANEVKYHVSTNIATVALLDGTVIETSGKTAQQIIEEILLAVAKQNGSKATTIGDVLYKDLDNTNIEIQFLYPVEGTGEIATVEYAIHFGFKYLTQEEREVKNDEVIGGLVDDLNTSLKNPPVLKDILSTQELEQIEESLDQDTIDMAYSALTEITFDKETNTLTFNVTEAGKTVPLYYFLLVGMDIKSMLNPDGDTDGMQALFAGSPILSMFTTFAIGSTKADYSVQGKDVPKTEVDKSDLQGANLILVALGLLQQMSTSENASAFTMTYNDVLNQTATANFYYQTEDGTEYSIPYTLTFKDASITVD